MQNQQMSAEHTISLLGKVSSRTQPLPAYIDLFDSYCTTFKLNRKLFVLLFLCHFIINAAAHFIICFSMFSKVGLFNLFWITPELIWFVLTSNFKKAFADPYISNSQFTVFSYHFKFNHFDGYIGAMILIVVTLLLRGFVLTNLVILFMVDLLIVLFGCRAVVMLKFMQSSIENERNKMRMNKLYIIEQLMKVDCDRIEQPFETDLNSISGSSKSIKSNSHYEQSINSFRKFYKAKQKSQSMQSFQNQLYSH